MLSPAGRATQAAVEAILRRVDAQSPRVRRELSYSPVRSSTPVAMSRSSRIRRVPTPFSPDALWQSALFHLALPLSALWLLLTRPRTHWRPGHAEALLLEVALWTCTVTAATAYAYDDGSGSLSPTEVYAPLVELLLLVEIYAVMRAFEGDADGQQQPLACEFAQLSRGTAENRALRKLAVRSDVQDAAEGALEGLSLRGRVEPPQRLHTLDQHHLGFLRVSPTPSLGDDSQGPQQHATARSVVPSPVGFGDVELQVMDDDDDDEFSAEAVACEIWGMTAGVKRWGRFYLVTGALAVAQALVGLTFWLATRDRGDRDGWTQRDSALAVATVLPTTYYSLQLCQLLHRVLFEYLRRAQVARYVGALLSRSLAPEFRLPFVDLGRADLSPNNVVAWCEVRDVLLRRVLGKSATRTSITLAALLATDVGLCLVAVVGFMSSSSSIGVFESLVLLDTLVLSVYVLLILRLAARANSVQRGHYNELAAALFTLRQQEATSAADLLTALIEFLRGDDELCCVFGAEVDSGLTMKLLLFLLASVGGQVAEFTATGG